MIAVIPMAGRGSRFADRGYETPKPLIEVAGVPMVIRAMKTLEHLNPSRFIFIALREHEERHGIRALLDKHLPGKTIDLILIDEVTEGQLCTVLAAGNLLDTDEDLLVAASDTYVKSNIASDIKNKTPETAGIISVCRLPGEQWSFARLNSAGWVEQVAEKVRISDLASTGLYYFSNARLFSSTGRQMIQNQEKTRGEYYIIPVYQKMIDQGMKIAISEAAEMWDMGTPEAKSIFESHIGSHTS